MVRTTPPEALRQQTTPQQNKPPEVTSVRGLRVLHVIDRLSMGGTQNLLLRALEALDARGVSSQVCVLGSEAQADPSYVQQVRPTFLDFRGEYRNPLAVRKCVGRLRSLIDTQQPDIVHSYLWVSDFVSALATRGRTSAHISHIVDRRSWQASNRMIHRFRRWGTQVAYSRAATRFIAVSRAAKEFASQHLAISPSDISVAANGINYEQFAASPPRNTPQRPIVLGTAGRIEEEKGHRYLVEAMKRLVEGGCDVRLVITGDGYLRSQLEVFVENENLQRHVQFVGWVPSVRDFYDSIDVFVVPSISAEGLPTTILEAMAAGCIVVASDVGGAGEAIRNGIDGWLVPPADAQALVERIACLSGHPQKFGPMIESARQRIQAQFTTERMVDVICERYNSAMKTRRLK